MSNVGLYTAGQNQRDPATGASKNGAAGSNTPNDDNWLQMARDAYRTSNDYFDANIRHNTERNLAHFSNRHAPGSKYYSEAYKYRAKGFRPKTRAVVRKNETAAAIALFSTADTLNISAENPEDLVQRVSAELNQELLQYRLDNTIPWFQTAMGAYQETLVSGVVISHQRWQYEEVIDQYEMVDAATGDSILDGETGEATTTEEIEVVHDTPAIELRPIENVLFSTAADWRDPLNTSPFLIDKIPMTIDEVKQMARQTGKTKVPWFELTDAQLMQGLTTDYDPVRAERENKRQDSKDQKYNTTGFETVWVHRNIMKVEGRDIIFYTLGIHHRLSDPIPLRDEYPHLRGGQRPYVLGVSNIEAHKNYPESLTGLTATLNQEANDINNQRRDNVALSLNRRYFTKRGADIDFGSLMKNVPGSITEMDDPKADIRVEAPPEVTSSSYQEQDRVNMDYDELAGSFSSSSVGSNRQLNETVGGMELLSGDANSVTEYQLRIFVETWVEPVLKQLVQLEQRHETDEALLKLMGDKVQMWQRHGVDRITDEMLQGNMTVKVNVGFGSTDPQKRINKLALGMNTVLQFVPQMGQRLDAEELSNEVFGALGYKNAERFFPKEPNPDAPVMEPAPDPRMAVEQFKAQANMQLAQFNMQADQQRLQMESQLKSQEMQLRLQSETEERQMKQVLAEFGLQSDMMELAGKKEISLEQIKAKLGEVSIKERGANERFIAEREFALTAGEGRGL